MTVKELIGILSQFSGEFVVRVPVEGNENDLHSVGVRWPEPDKHQHVVLNLAEYQNVQNRRKCIGRCK